MPLDKINPAAAASAYVNIQKTAASSGEGDATGNAGGDSGGMSFGALVKDGLSKGIETMKAGEKMSVAAVTGKADIADVVMAVGQAEQTLNTMVAIRDRAFNAYEEIMRMPI